MERLQHQYQKKVAQPSYSLFGAQSDRIEHFIFVTLRVLYIFVHLAQQLYLKHIQYFHDLT